MDAPVDDLEVNDFSLLEQDGVGLGTVDGHVGRVGAHT